MPHADRDARLSPKQVVAALARAGAALRRSGCVFAPRLGDQLRKLALITTDEQMQALEAVFREIGAEDYRGPHPPNHVAAEPACRGARMLSFVWQSARFRRRMFFKFALCGKGGKERLVVLSLHDDYRPNYYERLD